MRRFAIYNALFLVALFIIKEWDSLFRRPEKRPETRHCWHTRKKHIYLIGDVYDGEVCCYCGLEFNKHVKVPSPDHGEFVPPTKTPVRPSRSCPGHPKESK